MVWQQALSSTQADSKERDVSVSICAETVCVVLACPWQVTREGLMLFKIILAVHPIYQHVLVKGTMLGGAISNLYPGMLCCQDSCRFGVLTQIWTASSGALLDGTNIQGPDSDQCCRVSAIGIDRLVFREPHRVRINVMLVDHS
jgi:hypothetical protein